MTIDTLNWDKVTLGDIAQSLTIATKDPLSEGFERYVGLEHIEPGNIHIKSWGNVADGTTFTRVFRKGQVLFGKRRAYQKKAAMAEFDGICSGDILVCEAIKGTVLPELLPFIVQSDRFFEHAIKTSAGSLSPRTKFKDLAKFTFKLPAKPADQKRIADLLWSIDEVIEREQDFLLELKKFKKVTMNELLNGEHLRTLNGKIPIGWVEKKISQLGIVSTSSVDKKIKKGEKIINLINYMDVYTSDDKKITKLLKLMQVSANDNQLVKNQVRKGDVLFTPSSETSDDIGHSAVVYEEMPGTLYSYHLVRLRFNEKDDLDLNFKRFMFNNPRIMLHFSTRSKGITRMTLSLDDFNETKVLIPLKDEQQRIAGILSQIIDDKAAIERQIAKSKAIQKQIINQIFG